LDADVPAFATRPFLGVAFSVSVDFFLTGSVRLGLLDVAKKADAVVSSGSGIGFGLGFWVGGFFGVDFLGLYMVSLTSRQRYDVLTLCPLLRRQSPRQSGSRGLSFWVLLSFLSLSATVSDGVRVFQILQPSE
jgi:hypothetical protein